VSSGHTPVFSIIIATFNLSAALRIAVQSVLDQTFEDFEILVVGDACSDDSEEVIASFGDNRVKWFNLPTNHGSQWGPNNHGLKEARGEFVAYLGHDDLWWPSHLKTAFNVFRSTGADIVASGALLYGPPGSGVRALTGFFPNDVYSSRHFFPPSSMLHRLEISERAGGWPAPEDAMVAIDYDFLNRCYETGAKVVSSGEVTTFKFNAAWRRNAYRNHTPSEQQAFLDQMQHEGEAFRLKELTCALRAANEDRLQKIEIPPDNQPKATQSAAINHDFKGTRKSKTRLKPICVRGKRRYPVPHTYSGFEWHSVEQHPQWGEFRWSGPSRQSTLVFPEKIEQRTKFTLLIVNWINEELLKTSAVYINDVKVKTRLKRGPKNTWLYSGSIEPGDLPEDDREEIRLTLSLDKTWRPVDLNLNDDRRWLGLAVGWVEIATL